MSFCTRSIALLKLKSALLAGVFFTALLSVKAQANSLAFDETGNLYLIGTPGEIFKFTPDGKGSKFASEDGKPEWSDIAVDHQGNIFVSETTEHPHGKSVNVLVTILKFSPTGKRSVWIPNAGKGQPTGMARDSAGNIYVGIDSLEKVDTRLSIVKFTPAGKRSTVAKGLFEAHYLTFDATGNFFAFDGWSHAIVKFAPDGTMSTFAKDIVPYDLALSSAGSLFVADEQKNAIVKFDAAGARTTFAEIDSPSALVFDRTGNLFVWSNDKIFKFAPDGIKTLFVEKATGQ